MDAPSKWRFRFGLKGLLIRVAIAAVPLAWSSYSLRWIQERRDFRAAHRAQQIRFFVSYGWPDAPAGLWLFNEGGVCAWQADEMSESEVIEARRLFPESQIHGSPKM